MGDQIVEGDIFVTCGDTWGDEETCTKFCSENISVYLGLDK
jgi:hypothetical protein